MHCRDAFCFVLGEEMKKKNKQIERERERERGFGSYLLY
jgi:hypothetical protein